MKAVLTGCFGGFMATVPIPVANFIPETWKCSAEADCLVKRAKQGEQLAFLGLFQTHARRVYVLSLRFTGNVTAAENLTRDIFVKAFSDLDAVCDDEEFAALLYRHAATTIDDQASRTSPQ
jgi:DNA-directed RNA polymerase specialized sigma24 family protein